MLLGQFLRSPQTSSTSEGRSVGEGEGEGAIPFLSRMIRWAPKICHRVDGGGRRVSI